VSAVVVHQQQANSTTVYVSFTGLARGTVSASITLAAAAAAIAAEQYSPEQAADKRKDSSRCW
jgi:hypothetical protein